MIDRMNVFGNKIALRMDKPAKLSKHRRQVSREILDSAGEYNWFYEFYYDIKCSSNGKDIYKRRPKGKTIFIDGNYRTLGSALFYLKNPIKCYNYMDALLTTKGFIGMDDMKGVYLIIQLPNEMSERVLNFTMECIKKFIKRNGLHVIVCGTKGQCRKLDTLFH